MKPSFAMLMDDQQGRMLRLVLHAGRVGLIQDSLTSTMPDDLKKFSKSSVEFAEDIISNIDAVLGHVPWPDEPSDAG
jgi:hypothetical protein